MKEYKPNLESASIFAIPIYKGKLDGISDELGLERIVRDNIIEFDISREHLPWQSPDIVPLQTKEDLYTLEELNPLMELIGEASYNVAVQSFKYDPTYTVNFTSVWGNIQRQGNVMHEHSHSNNIFSGVFYLNEHEHFPGLIFYRPMEKSFELLVKEHI